MDELVGGIKEMLKMPEAIFVVDIKKDETAVFEANKKKIPVIAMCDTNVNPSTVAYPIPANDDSVKSIEMVCSLLAEAVNEGRNSIKK